MRPRRLSLWLCLAAAFGCQGSDEGTGAPTETAGSADESPLTAFVHANVISMETGEVLPDHTILVWDGRILELGPSPVVGVLSFAEVIDARGKYVMPGLADMHSHLFWPQQLAHHLPHGITTVRLMWGGPHQLVWRKGIEEGDLVGPTLHISGPIVNGCSPSWMMGPAWCEDDPSPPFPMPPTWIVEDAETADRVVRAQRAAGYDFIKPYSHLDRDSYVALMAAARQYGIPVAGHVPEAVGIEGALEAGQASIEHFICLDFCLSDEFQDQRPPWTAPRRETLAWLFSLGREVLDGRISTSDLFDDERLRDQARAVAAAGGWVTPTMHAGFEDNPEWPPEAEVWAERNRREVRALRDAGVLLLAGTDRDAFWVPDELESLQRAGLTPFEALRTATRGAAEFLGELDQWGTVAAGKRADLILLDANPLEDVANTKALAGVMLRGHWFTIEELEAMTRAGASLGRAVALAAEGNVEEALAAFAEAEATESLWPIPAHGLNQLCWYGSHAGQPELVMPHCDRAIADEPDFGWFRDSRALARGLTGDLEGAAEDVEVFLEWSETAVGRSWPGMDEDRKRWRGWLEQLHAGVNPFTPEVLEELAG